MDDFGFSWGCFWRLNGSGFLASFSFSVIRIPGRRLYCPNEDSNSTLPLLLLSCDYVISSSCDIVDHVDATRHARSQIAPPSRFELGAIFIVPHTRLLYGIVYDWEVTDFAFCLFLAASYA